MDFEFKKIFAQFRLLNRFNYRVIVKNGILKLDYDHTSCSYCNRNCNDFVHMICDCERYAEERMIFFCNLNLNKDLSCNLIDHISHPNISFLRSFIKFFTVILKKSETEGSTNFINF